MMIRGGQIQRIVHGRCSLFFGRTFRVTRIAASFFLVRLWLCRRVRAFRDSPSSLQFLCGRLHRQLFHVTRARCRAVRLPRADLPDKERRVLCRPAIPPSTSL